MNYKAGELEGDDTVLIQDTGTGEEVLVEIKSMSSLKSVPSPSCWEFLVGSSGQLTVAGGSGSFSYKSVPSEGLLYEDGRLVGSLPGTYQVSIEDVFTGALTEVEVDVLSPVFVESAVSEKIW